MNWSLDEILLYGGIAFTVVSGIGLLVCGLLSKLKETRILSQLEKEYGEPQSPVRRRK